MALCPLSKMKIINSEFKSIVIHVFAFIKYPLFQLKNYIKIIGYSIIIYCKNFLYSLYDILQKLNFQLIQDIFHYLLE